VRRQAGVRIAGLIAQAAFERMLTRLGRQVCMENELSGVHTELLARSDLQGIVRTRWEVHRGYVNTRRFDNRQPRGNQQLIQRCVGVDMEAVRHPEVKIDLSVSMSGNSYLCGREERNMRIRRERQWLIFHQLQQQNHHRPEEHLLAPGGQRLFDAGLYFVFRNQSGGLGDNLPVTSYKIGRGEKLDPAILA
jgi:hypothetical protein